VDGLDDFTFTQGDEVTFALSSLMMTGATDLVDETVTVALGKKTVGTFDVINELPTDVLDEHGTAAVAFTVPKNVKGDTTLTITGDTTGTVVTFDVTVEKKANPGNGQGPGHGNGHGHGWGHGWGRWWGHGSWYGLTPYYPNGAWTGGESVWSGGFQGFGR
jgi:hypothetical protein